MRKCIIISPIKCNMPLDDIRLRKFSNVFLTTFITESRLRLLKYVNNSAAASSICSRESRFLRIVATALVDVGREWRDVPRLAVC